MDSALCFMSQKKNRTRYEFSIFIKLKRLVPRGDWKQAFTNVSYVEESRNVSTLHLTIMTEK